MAMTPSLGPQNAEGLFRHHVPARQNAHGHDQEQCHRHPDQVDRRSKLPGNLHAVFADRPGEPDGRGRTYGAGQQPPSSDPASRMTEAFRFWTSERRLTMEPSPIAMHRKKSNSRRHDARISRQAMFRTNFIAFPYCVSVASLSLHLSEGFARLIISSLGKV